MSEMSMKSNALFFRSIDIVVMGNPGYHISRDIFRDAARLAWGKALPRETKVYLSIVILGYVTLSAYNP